MSITHDLVTFDLDGTLVETAAEIAEAANRALATQGYAPRPVAEIQLLIGGGMNTLMRTLAERLAREGAGTPDVAALAGCVDAHYAAVIGSLARPYPGTESALMRLRAAGVKVACVTNKEAVHAARLLDCMGLTELFDLLVGGDTLPRKKPHPSVLLHVVDHFLTEPGRTAHVGDSIIDLDAARSAGVAAWAVPYGYNAGVPIEQQAPDRLFPDLPSVVDHVLGRPMAS